MLPHFDLEKNTSAIYYLIAILGSIWAGIKYGFKYVKGFFVGIYVWHKRLDESMAKIEAISKEFQPNHGSSLKDQINKIQLELFRNTELTEKISTRQKWIFDSEDMPIFESDNEGKCVWVNIAYLKLVNRDMQSLLGHGWKNVIAESERARVVANWEDCVKDGRDSEDTYHIVDSEGKVIKVFTAACKTGKFGYVGAIKIVKEDE